ncbi:MAG: SDR family NAD(P)-dependent oxidoreductase [Janthinobacterium lividum]
MSASGTQTRIAIVTGAGLGNGGLGRHIAGQLARDGLSLMIADIDPQVEKLAESIRGETGVEVLWHAGDLSQEAQVEAMVAKTIERFGRIDVLVNNAGGGIITPFLKHDAASLTTTINRNLWTTLWACHKTLPHMVERKHGRIVNIGADSLRTGIPDHAGYNAAKGGVVGMTVGLAREFAHLDITVNTVSPCVINTERFRGMMQNNPTLSKAFTDVVPKGRGAEISEVADMVSFLARIETAFITGQDFSVNGGSAMP